MPAEPLDSTESEEIEEQTAPRRRSMLARVNMALILVVVVAVECLAASMILPDVRKTAEMVGATIPVPPSEDQVDPLAGVDALLDNQIEVDLGGFQFSAYQPLTNTTKRVDLHMWGTINKDDEKVFLELKNSSEHRLRDQILVIFRSSDASDLTDGKLGLIKRKILETSNRILGKPLLSSVVFSDFSYIEQ
jgi:flagellar FliL protein